MIAGGAGNKYGTLAQWQSFMDKAGLYCAARDGQPSDSVTSHMPNDVIAGHRERPDNTADVIIKNRSAGTDANQMENSGQVDVLSP